MLLIPKIQNPEVDQILTALQLLADQSVSTMIDNPNWQELDNLSAVGVMIMDLIVPHISNVQEQLWAMMIARNLFTRSEINVL